MYVFIDICIRYTLTDYINFRGINTCYYDVDIMRCSFPYCVNSFRTNNR